MTYERLQAYMPTNRKWCRWGIGLYLQKFRGAIRVRYGYRYHNSQVMAVWYPDGRFKFLGQQYYSSMRNGLRSFMPDGYNIQSHRYSSFISVPGEDPDNAKAFWLRENDLDGVGPVQKLGRVRFNQRHKWVMITKAGLQGKFGPMLKTIKAELKAKDYARDKPRRRGRYWRGKAMGIYRDRCGKNFNQGCKWLRTWPRPAAGWTGECGCHVYTKKAVSRDTVASILAEPNATVRTAKIQIYGIEKFFTDAKAETINKEAGYELLTLDTGSANQDPVGWLRPQQTANVVLTALRMECPSTGKIYVNTVPPQMRTVRQALDWIYDIENYLGRVGHQT